MIAIGEDATAVSPLKKSAQNPLTKRLNTKPAVYTHITAYYDDISHQLLLLSSQLLQETNEQLLAEIKKRQVTR